MQYCGIKINSITYFIIVMAIGLLVDFLMHILLRYYETKGTTRHEKVKGTLESMGASILLGGFTTWLGVIPLAFSTTKVFMTVSTMRFIPRVSRNSLELKADLTFLSSSCRYYSASGLSIILGNGNTRMRCRLGVVARSAVNSRSRRCGRKAL